MISSMLVLSSLISIMSPSTLPPRWPTTVFTRFQYPGTGEGRLNTTSDIAQGVWFTSDALEKVIAWYYPKLAIDPAFRDGVATLPWPAGVKVTEARGQQQWALTRDDIRPRTDGTGHKTIRPPTMQQFIARTPEHLVIILLQRNPGDAQTMITITTLPNTRAVKR